MIKQSISDIKNSYKNIAVNALTEFITLHKEDERQGVKKIVEQAIKKLNSYIAECERIEKMKLYEKKYGQFSYVCGVDEVGRGPLAGPVVTAAVILPKDCTILYINDSKKLSETKREELYREIKEKAIAIEVGVASPETIDRVNILNATLLAMKNAVHALQVQPEVVLVDAVTIPEIRMKQESIIKGDEKSISIAAASIIAKVTRDRMMKGYADLFTDYAFDKNKGYGTKEHIEAIKNVGPCPIHRHSFIQNFV